MIRSLTLVALALVLATAPAFAGGLSGQYVEARTTDIWTGPCFANAAMNLSGRNAVLVWKIDKGDMDKVRLDGLSVVAVIAANDTLGLEQTGPSKAVLIVDARADESQRKALVRLAKEQGGELTRNIVAIEAAPVSLTMCECKEDVCAKLTAGSAKVETKCLDLHHDKVCGNESAYYPPLAKNVKVRAAKAVENSFNGKGFNATWKDAERRSAYVGSFEIR